MKRVALITIAVGLVGAGAAIAAPSGVSRVVVAKGTMEDVSIEAKGPVEVSHRITTWEPKGTSGWASWAGDFVLTMNKGEITFYNERESDCTVETYTVGESWIVRGGSVFQAVNTGPDIAEVHWVAFLPPGTVIKEETKPAGCPDPIGK